MGRQMLAKRARCYLAASKPPGIELDELFKLKSEVDYYHHYSKNDHYVTCSCVLIVLFP